MATLAVQLTIGDYAKWRPVFDKHKPLRDKADIKKVRVYRDADNPKEVMGGKQPTLRRHAQLWQAMKSKMR